MLLLAALIAAPPTLGSGQAENKSDEAERIERDCGLKFGTITIDGDHVKLTPSPDAAYDGVDCALERLKEAGLGKLGFVGNEMDPNAVVRPPLRYIAEGSPAQIAALVKAAKGSSWIVTRTARASDGTSFVQIETQQNATNGEATKFLDRIWAKEFGDLEFGFAPRRLSDLNANDD